MKQIQIEKLFILILQFREKKNNSYELPTIKIILKSPIIFQWEIKSFTFSLFILNILY